MSLFDAFVGGAADQATGILDRQMKEEADLERQKQLTQFQADLAEAKMRTTLAIQQEFRDAPLKRLGSKAQEFAGQDVPVDAPEPVTKVSGILASGAQIPGTDGKPIQIPEGTSDRGIIGNIAALKKQVEEDKSMSAEDRAGFLAQLESQAAAENKANADSVAGKTRSRTSDEAMQSALDWAKVNDPVAYADYQSRIGRSDRDERRIDNQEKRLAQSDANANRRLDIQQQFNESHAQWQRSMADIAEKRAQRMEDRTVAQYDKAELQSTRQAITSVLKDIATQEDKIQMKLMDPMLSPEQRTVLEGQFKALDASRTQARAELLKLAGVEPTTAKQSPPPDGTRGIVDGVVGTVINGKFVPDVKETKGKNTTKTRDPNIPTFSTFEKEMPASQAELVAAQNAVEEAKSRMESNRNAMTINAYNQAVTNLTALNHRGK